MTVLEGFQVSGTEGVSTKADSTPHCHVVAWSTGRCPYPLKSEAGRREGPEVLRIGELILPPKDCNTREIGPNNTPWKPSKADPAGSDVGEPGLRA